MAILGPQNIAPHRYHSGGIVEHLHLREEDNPDSSYNTQKITQAVLATLPPSQAGNLARIVGSVQGLLRGMNPKEARDFLQAMQVSATPNNAVTITDNAIEAERLRQDELIRKAALERQQREAAEPGAEEKRRAAWQRIRSANTNSAEALAAAALLLGGSDKIAAAWSNYERLRRNSGLELATAISFGEILSDIRSGNMQRGVVQSGYSGSEYMSISYAPAYYSARDPFVAAYNREIARLERQQEAQYQQWQNENQIPNASPVIPARQREVNNSIVENNPGARVDPKSNHVFVPGVGEIATDNNQSRVVKTPAQLAEEQRNSDFVKTEAARMGGVPNADGKTYTLPNGSVIRPNMQRGMNEVVVTAEQARRKAEAQRQSLARTMPEERRALLDRSGLPADSPSRALHNNGVPVTPERAAEIRQSVMRDKETIAQTVERTRRDALVATVVPRTEGDNRPRAEAPPAPVTQGITNIATEIGKGTPSADRLAAVPAELLYHPNQAISAPARREYMRAWTDVGAGVIRRSWNAYYNNSLWGNNPETPEQRAQRDHDTAVWAHERARAARIVVTNTRQFGMNLWNRATSVFSSTPTVPEAPAAPVAAAPATATEQPGMLRSLWNRMTGATPVVPPAAPPPAAPAVPPAAPEATPIIPERGNVPVAAAVAPAPAAALPWYRRAYNYVTGNRPQDTQVAAPAAPPAAPAVPPVVSPAVPPVAAADAERLAAEKAAAEKAAAERIAAERTAAVTAPPVVPPAVVPPAVPPVAAATVRDRLTGTVPAAPNFTPIPGRNMSPRRDFSALPGRPAAGVVAGEGDESQRRLATERPATERAPTVATINNAAPAVLNNQPAPANQTVADATKPDPKPEPKPEPAAAPAAAPAPAPAVAAQAPPAAADKDKDKVAAATPPKAAAPKMSA